MKSFSSADYAFLFSYAQETKLEGLSLGGNAKVVHRKVGKFAKAWGFGLDAGAQYEKGKWTFGAVGKDITSTFNACTYNTENLKEVFDQTGNAIPENGLEVTLPKLILGTAFKTNIVTKITVNPAVDLDITFDGKRNVLLKTPIVSFDPVMGVQVGYAHMIFLRAGIRNIQEVKRFDGTTYRTVQPDFGLGIAVYKFTLDYALTNIGSQGEGLFSHIFSLRVAFTR